MRPLLTLTVALTLTAALHAQDEIPARFDVLPNLDTYPQASPQQALQSALTAMQRDRYDYLVAHLLDPEFVDGRLNGNQSYFERVAGEQIAATAAGAALRGAELETRIRTVALRLNVQDLIRQIQRKLADQPDYLRDLNRFARDGQFLAAGETATATLPDVKDRALYFKKVGNRWFLENRKDQKPAPKE